MRASTRVALNIRRLRVQQGISQEHLAVDADVDRTYVSRVERELENPTVGVLEKLASALGVDVAELLAVPSDREKSQQTLPRGRRPKRP